MSDQSIEGEPEALEGGEVTEAEAASAVRERRHERRLRARIGLAYFIIAILGVSVVAHYVAVFQLLPMPEDLSGVVPDDAALERHLGMYESNLAALEKIFGAWLPVIAGLAGSAVTFFFTRENGGQ